MRIRFGLGTMFTLFILVAIFCWVATQEFYLTQTQTDWNLVPRQTGSEMQLREKQTVRRRVNPAVLLVGLAALLTVMWMMMDARRQPPATRRDQAP